MQQLAKFGSRSITTFMQAGVFLLGMAAPVAAQCDPNQGGISEAANCARPTNVPSNLFGNDSIFSRVSNILIFVVGAVSVIMLIIGGFRYVLSGGDSSAVEGAKNTILYAIIGIIVAILAYAAVNFVISNINK